jgi:hypothetical protein
VADAPRRLSPWAVFLCDHSSSFKADALQLQHGCKRGREGRRSFDRPGAHNNWIGGRVTLWQVLPWYFRSPRAYSFFHTLLPSPLLLISYILHRLHALLETIIVCCESVMIIFGCKKNAKVIAPRFGAAI